MSLKEPTAAEDGMRSQGWFRLWQHKSTDDKLTMLVNFFMAVFGRVNSS